MCSLTLSAILEICTVNASDLAPHDSDLGATDFLGGAVDEGDLLSEVEAAGLGVVDTLDLDQAGVGVGVALASLVAEVTSPVRRKSINILCAMRRSFCRVWKEWCFGRCSIVIVGSDTARWA
jgi:hypothetical protein